MSYSIMFQFRHRDGAPSLGDVRRTFDLSTADIDDEYGVVTTDDAEGLHVVMLTPDAAERVEALLARSPRDPAVGTFSNPRIEPTDEQPSS